MTDQAPVIVYDDDAHSYTFDGKPVPSVTQILDSITPKEALPWWGMRVGLAAVIGMVQMNQLSWGTIKSAIYKDHVKGKPSKGTEVYLGKQKKPKTPLEAQAIKSKLTTNHIKTAAADRGTIVHEAIQSIGLSDKMPDLDAYPEEWRGYLRGFARFWLDQDPEIIEQEVIVANTFPGAIVGGNVAYCGRYDLGCLISKERVLIDFKTSSGIYDQHHTQLAMYDLGQRFLARWTGEAPYDRLAIVRLAEDGNYEMVDAGAPDAEVRAGLELYYARNPDKWEALNAKLV